MDASARQLELIRALLDTEHFASLPPALQAMARARLQAPDLSLEELGQTLDPPIGKSGVNHRMRRLLACAREALPDAPAPTP
jgi:DNA-binding protein WhiA